MAEERDGKHLGAEKQIVQARAALIAPVPAGEQLAFERLES